MWIAWVRFGVVWGGGWLGCGCMCWGGLVFCVAVLVGAFLCWLYGCVVLVGDLFGCGCVIVGALVIDALVVGGCFVCGVGGFCCGCCLLVLFVVRLCFVLGVVLVGVSQWVLLLVWFVLGLGVFCVVWTLGVLGWGCCV